MSGKRAGGTKPRGIDFDADLARRLRDPEFRHHYEQRRIIQEIAMTVRGMREAVGLTQEQLARAIGSRQPAIARLEKGLDQRTPQWDTLRRIAAALNKQLKLVFDDPSDKGSFVEVRGKLRRLRPQHRADASPATAG